MRYAAVIKKDWLLSLPLRLDSADKVKGIEHGVGVQPKRVELRRYRLASGTSPRAPDGPWDDDPFWLVAIGRTMKTARGQPFHLYTGVADFKLAGEIAGRALNPPPKDGPEFVANADRGVGSTT